MGKLGVYLAVHAEKGVAAAAADRLVLRLLRLNEWRSWGDDGSHWDAQVARSMLLIEDLQHNTIGQ